MSQAPRARVRDVRVYLRRVTTRMPFRYGKAVVTGQPYAHVRAAVECDGRAVTGVSAAALPPLWFDKDPAKDHEENIRDLLRSLRFAAENYLTTGPASAWTLHAAAEPEARGRCSAAGLNDLTSGFGVALMDAAVVDAVCRAAGRTFHQALREDLLGYGPVPAPDRPLDRILVRHTIGLSDPIRASDATQPVGDGLPETLQAVIRVYGVRHFKAKLSGDLDASLDRLRRIASVLDHDCPDYRMTLDGNEQFSTLEEVAELQARLAEDTALDRLRSRTLWIEQPLDRKVALSTAVPGRSPLPLLIDESDGTDAAVGEALVLGYAGISAKNCKGVFRTLHSLRRVRAADAILSSEDLMNIPVVPLHQDLCVAAAAGIPHSERNGHHYIRAFEFFSPREREAALREYPSLYRERPDGPPALRIEDGAIDLREINAFAFGVRSEPDWERLEPVRLA